jgi:hypothetical protein
MKSYNISKTKYYDTLRYAKEIGYIVDTFDSSLSSTDMDLAEQGYFSYLVKNPITIENPIPAKKLKKIKKYLKI